MSFISFIQYHYFKGFSKLLYQNRNHANECQQKTFIELISKGKTTSFGKEHHFEKIKNYEDFKHFVPLRPYEDFVPYIQKIFNGEKSVLWPGKPIFFGKSSGTTGKSKYLPVTADFLKSTQYAAKYMICNLMFQLKHADFTAKKILYLTDQQPFEEVNGFKCGAISTIKSVQMPQWANYFTVPEKQVNEIENPAAKLDAIIDSLPGNDIRMAVALPVWLSHFLKQFEIRNGNTFKDVFPHFNVLFVSGMNYEPYENLLRHHLGDETIIMENYSATEGNIAYQNTPQVKGMELICNQGIFYEFIPLNEINKEHPLRLQLKDVNAGNQYSIVITANNGLWAYVINDIVEFVSTKPYRLIVCGRLKDIFSPFGEQMLPTQAEQAMAATCMQTQSMIADFLIIPDFSNPVYRYKCYIEFEEDFPDKENFQCILEKNLCSSNSYYDDLVKTKVIALPEIIPVRRNFFYDLLQHTQKNIFAQQKMTHLVNNSTITTIIENMLAGEKQVFF